jgi:hypothetical protein
MCCCIGVIDLVMDLDFGKSNQIKSNQMNQIKSNQNQITSNESNQIKIKSKSNHIR